MNPTVPLLSPVDLELIARGEHPLLDKAAKTPAAAIAQSLLAAKSNSEEEVKELIRRQMAPFQGPARQRIIQGVNHILHKAKAETDAHRAEVAAKRDAYLGLQIWIDSMIEKGVHLEANQASRMHKLIEAGIAGKIQTSNAPDEPFPGEKLASWNHVFVVKHDWAQAFQHSEGLDGEFHLPYDLCVFEFRVNGKSVTALCWDHEIGLVKTGKRLGFSLVVESNGMWFDYGRDDCNTEDPLFKLVWDNIRAISVALEAEVAVHDVVRAPVALNKKRAGTGKIPLRDHYIIDLARRHRIANPAPSNNDEPKSRKRLHFRRGHWRHYEASKTWIKWTLVGNPDLGFIQKGYSL